MIGWYEWFRSVEWIWCLWLVSVGFLSWKATRVLRRGRLFSWRRLIKSETGAAYTFSYVITFPFYLLLIGLALESTLLLVTKIGSVYATYAAARSVAVWNSASDSNTVRTKAHHAAAQAMIPFASGASQHRVAGGLAPNSAELRAITAAYKAYRGEGDVYSDTYMQAKCRYAWAATQVESNVTEGENGLVTVVLKYRAPLHVPVISRILGTRATDGSFFYYPIETQVVLNSEDPPGGTTGINYP